MYIECYTCAHTHTHVQAKLLANTTASIFSDACTTWIFAHRLGRHKEPTPGVRPEEHEQLQVIQRVQLRVQGARRALQGGRWESGVQLGLPARLGRQGLLGLLGLLGSRVSGLDLRVAISRRLLWLRDLPHHVQDGALTVVGVLAYLQMRQPRSSPAKPAGCRGACDSHAETADVHAVTQTDCCKLLERCRSRARTPR